MSELIDARTSRTDLRWNLLTTVSALALLGFTCGASKARASDNNTDRPNVWIELGGQLENAGGGQEPFLPPFAVSSPRPAFETISPVLAQRAPHFSNGLEGAIAFEPEGTDWVFSVSLRYGRSNGYKTTHQQTKPAPFPLGPGFVVPYVSQQAAKFSDVADKQDESHFLLDFTAGKDLGLGMFGGHGQSVVSLGVRIAQFDTHSNVSLKSDPDAHFHYKYLFGKFPYGTILHSNAANADARRSFHGIGPSIAWNATALVAGNPQGGEISFDWGANAAVLFGRQKAKVSHHTTALYHPFNVGRNGVPHLDTVLYQTSKMPPARDRMSVVPNIGGFGGLSFRYTAAKISLGYRADFFFGAMDGGIDAAKNENRGFSGPFATISIGLGG